MWQVEELGGRLEEELATVAVAMGAMAVAQAVRSGAFPASRRREHLELLRWAVRQAEEDDTDTTVSSDASAAPSAQVIPSLQQPSIYSCSVSFFGESNRAFCRVGAYFELFRSLFPPSASQTFRPSVCGSTAFAISSGVFPPLNLCLSLQMVAPPKWLPRPYPANWRGRACSLDSLADYLFSHAFVRQDIIQAAGKAREADGEELGEVGASLTAWAELLGVFEAGELDPQARTVIPADDHKARILHQIRYKHHLSAPSHCISLPELEPWPWRREAGGTGVDCLGRLLTTISESHLSKSCRDLAHKTHPSHHLKPKWTLIQLSLFFSAAKGWVELNCK